MAQWVRRPRTDGGESIQIKWRIDGRWQSETFTDARLAVEFRTAVELAGHRWPEGWVRGEGWATVVPAPGRGVAVLPEPEPEPVVTLAEVANGPEGYFAHQRKRVLRGKVKPYTVHRAERAFALHLEPAFGACAFVGLGPFGDEGARADVSAALDAGVEAALSYLERYGVAGTVGGRNRPGLGLAVASYRHEISRSEEAHLHVHNIIANAVAVPLLDDDGRPVLDEQGVARVEWRALDGEVLLGHVKTAGFIGAAALRHELSRRRGLRWGSVCNGVAELGAFPKMLLEAFSTRHGELTEEFARLVDAGFTSDAGTLAAAQRGSRIAKRVLSDPHVEALQRAKLTDAGWTVAAVQALTATRQGDGGPLTSSDVEGLFGRLCHPQPATAGVPR